MGKWTHFYDLHSGGEAKTEHESIAIEGEEEVARDRLESMFGVSSYGVSCECCGSDFSVTEFESLETLLEIYPNAHQIPSTQSTK